MRWVVPLFVLVPLVELGLLTWLSTLTSIWVSIALVLGTGLLGGLVAKREAARVWREWRRALASGELPQIGLVESLLVLVGATLLITPGVLTDLAGLSLMLPFVRKPLARRLKASLLAGLEQGKLGPFSVLGFGAPGGPFSAAPGGPFSAAPPPWSDTPWSAASEDGGSRHVVETAGESVGEEPALHAVPRLPER